MVKVIYVWGLFCALLSSAVFASGIKRTLVYSDHLGVVQTQNSAQLLSQEENNYLDLIKDHGDYFEYKKAASGIVPGKLIAILDDVSLVKIRMVIDLFSKELSVENKGVFASRFFQSVYPGKSIFRLKDDLEIFVDSLARVADTMAPQTTMTAFVEGRLQSLKASLSSRQRAALIRAKMLASLSDDLNGVHKANEARLDMHLEMESQEPLQPQNSKNRTLLHNKGLAYLTGGALALALIFPVGALLDQSRFINIDQFKVLKESVQISLPEGTKLLIAEEEAVQVGDVLFETYVNEEYDAYVAAVRREKIAVAKELEQVQDKLQQYVSKVEAAELRLDKIRLEQKSLALSTMRFSPQGGGVLVAHVSPVAGVIEQEAPDRLRVTACASNLILQVSEVKARGVDFDLPVRFDYGDRHIYQTLQSSHILRDNTGMVEVFVPIDGNSPNDCALGTNLQNVQFQRK